MQAPARRCEVCESSNFAPMFEKADHSFVRCEACGLERIDPAPTDETLAAIYGKHYYDAWGLHGDENTVAQLKKGTFGTVLDALPESVRGGKLLDCGAATGFLLEVAKERGFDPYGIELSEFGASEIAKKFGEGHAFRGEIENASFPGIGEGEFQVITMCDYIEHVRNPKRVLEHAMRFLAPGGVIALTTPDAGSMTHKILGSGWSHYKTEHLYYFKGENLRRLLEGVGFKDATSRPLWKSLNLKYIREQFEVYPHPVLSKVVRGLGKVVPGAVQRQPLKILTGELIALARR